MGRAFYESFNQQGHSLAELVIASAISLGVALGGYHAYTYFNNQTKTELTKLSDVQQFNALTKDMLRFAESAGISTLYLNLPVAAKSCEDNRPCLRALSEAGAWENPTNVPGVVQSETCLQFFRDSLGKPINKHAYPPTDSKPLSEELQGMFRNYNVITKTGETYFTWPLKDENSVPFLLMKVRDIGAHFKLVGTPKFQFDRANLRPGSTTSVFESPLSPDQAKKFVGYPFVLYGSKNQGQFGIYVAHEIVPCRDDKLNCATILNNNMYNGGYVEADITNEMFVLDIRPIDMEKPFFAEIYSRLNHGSDCTFSWGGTQASSNYLFPNGLLSIYNSVNSAANINADSSKYYHPMLYNKHASIEAAIHDLGSPSYAYALPIDLIRYSVDKVGTTAGQTRYSLISQLWHLTDTKKLIKISHLKAPLWFSRKLGSSELGIWYNFSSSPGAN